ncbi:MAG: pilus assembly protein TadG-related protein, partial [Alphaproteobacteria bacterium]
MSNSAKSLRSRLLAASAPLTKKAEADQRANVAVIFAICIIPIVGLIGGDVDYSNATRVRSQMQNALDAAALAGARQRQVTGSETEARRAVENSMAANLPPELRGRSFNVTFGSGANPTVTVTMNTDVETNFAKVLGIPKFDIGGLAQTSYGTGGLEIVLALDVTGSLRADVEDMKAGARALVQTVFQSRGS